MRGFEFIKSWRCYAGAIAALLALPSATRASNIDLDNYQLLPDTPSQQVQIFIGGPDALQNTSLNVFAGDGGRDVGANVAPPELSAMDLFANGSILPHTVGFDEAQANSNATTSQSWETTSAYNGMAALARASMMGRMQSEMGGMMSGNHAMVLDRPISPTAFPTGSRHTLVASIFNRSSVSSGGAAAPLGGTVTPFPAPVPEPASVGLLGLVIPALLLRRRQRITPA